VPYINDLVSASPIAQWGAFYIEVLHPVVIDLSFRPVMFARGRLVFVKFGAEFILRGFDKGARLGDRESVYPLFERGN